MRIAMARFCLSALCIWIMGGGFTAFGAAPAARHTYTPDELIFLNGVGGFGDVGQLDVSRTVVSPRSTLGFSLKVVWEDHPNPPGWWSIRMGIPGAPARMDAFEFDLYVQSADEKASLNVFLYERDDDRWVCWGHPLHTVEQGKWLHVRVPRAKMRMWFLGNHKPEWDKIHGVAFESSKGKAVFYVDAVRLTGPDGKAMPIFTVADDGLHPDSVWHETPRSPRQPGVVYFPFDCARLDRADLLHTPPALAAALGAPVGTPISGYNKTIVDKVRFLRGKGVEPIFYSSFASGYMRFLTRRQAWDSTADGRSLNRIPRFKTHWDAQHAIALAHPAVTEALKHKVDALLAAGLGTWMVVDYTFPWWDTWWGYAPAMLDAYRHDLGGTDDGLVVRDGTRQRLLHFPDYFRAYNGFFPAPADLGLKDWAAFTPPKPGDAGDEFVRRRKIMFLYLRSWEWLKLPDRIGRYMKAKGGSGLWIVPNPEDTFGSSDYVFLVRSAGVENLFPEWFGPIGWAAEAGYASLPYLHDQAVRGGARLSIIQETGAGGHSMPYLDWRIAFNGVYALSVAGKLADFDNDFIDHVPFAVESDPKAGGNEFRRFRDAAAKALAFRMARTGGFARPRADILCVAERPPAKTTGSIFFGLAREHSLAVGLSRAHLVFDLRDSFELDRVLERYRIIAYSPWAPRKGDLERLVAWLRAGRDRVLITHSFVPTRSTEGFWQDRKQDVALGKTNGAGLLGLGAITAGTAKSVRVTAATGAWQKLFLPGFSIKLTAPLTKCTGGTPVVFTDAGPLVSEARVGNGTVVYLHYTPGDSVEVQRRLDVPVMRFVAGRADIAPVCTADFDALVQVFEKSGVRTVVAWDAPAMGKWKWAYHAGIAPMAFAAAGVSRRITVPVPPDTPSGTKWRVYDFWNDVERTVPIRDRAVVLGLKDVLTGLYVVGADSAATRAKIAIARKTRRKLHDLHFDDPAVGSSAH